MFSGKILILLPCVCFSPDLGGHLLRNLGLIKLSGTKVCHIKWLCSWCHNILELKVYIYFGRKPAHTWFLERCFEWGNRCGMSLLGSCSVVYICICWLLLINTAVVYFILLGRKEVYNLSFCVGNFISSTRKTFKVSFPKKEIDIRKIWLVSNGKVPFAHRCPCLIL